MKKNILVFFLILACVVPVSSQQNLKDEFETAFEYSEEQYVMIDGVEEKLFKEFKNQNESISVLEEHCGALLDKIMNFSQLDSISSLNIADYYSYMLDNYENEDGYEVRFFKKFIDIYENKEKNDIVKEVNKIDRTAEDDYLLATNLPIDSVFVERYFNDLSSNYQEPLYLVGSSGINYALNYAENPNTASYAYFSGADCANFLSQILEASGVCQDVYTSASSGWWHKYNPSVVFNQHTHSYSWTVADTFCRYMGITYTTTNHYNFSQRLLAGSIIAADFENDGDYDHMGFVVAADDYTDTYYGYTYFDYRVAQHSSNYVKWTSNTANGWELIGIDGGKYATIRY